MTAGRARAGAGPARVAGLSALATALVFVPQLATDPGDLSPGLHVVWLLVLLVAAPVVAAVLSRRASSAPDRPRPVLVAAPQLLVTVCLFRLDTWLEVRSGYLLPGSGEEAMSYGLGFVLSTVLGTVLVGLVALGAHLGGQRREPPPG